MRVEREELRQLGARVRAERKQRGLSQKKLAALTGMHRTYVGGLERGERNIGALNLIAIARALGVRVGVFFEGGDHV